MTETSPSAAPPGRRIGAVRVVIPVRNEQDNLPRCLTAVADATHSLRERQPDVACTVHVVLDRCTDDSAAIATRAGVLTHVSTAGAVGAARRLGVALATAGDDPASTWVANTDADTLVPPDWLTGQLAIADTGIDLIVGSVQPDPADLDPAALVGWWARHRLHEGHEYVHGANLGVLLAAYQQAGGFPPVAVHEDVQLVEAIRATGSPHLATTRIQVTTSGRRAGRTGGGFATYLTSLTPTSDRRTGTGQCAGSL